MGGGEGGAGKRGPGVALFVTRRLTGCLSSVGLNENFYLELRDK